MIGKITLSAALLIGTAALAQQPPANPSPPPSQAPSTQNPSQSQGTQCWDMATNQVRDRSTVGAGGNQPGGANRPGGAASPPPSSNPGAAGSAASRPAGMPNC